MTAAPSAPPRVERKERRGFHAFDALRHREYRLLWFGLVISNVGAWMQLVSMGWLVYSLTDSPFWLGMVGFARAIPVFIFTLWSGVLADRVDRRRVMLVSDVLTAVFALILGVMVAIGLTDVRLVLLMAFLTASAWAFEVPARQSLVPDLVPRADMINAIGLQSAAFNAAGVLGPVLAALVIAQGGLAPAFYINAFLTLTVVGALLMMKPVQPSGLSRGGALSNLVEGLRYVRCSPSTAALLAMVAVINLTARPFIQLMPVFARDILFVGASGLGVLMGVVGAGGLTGAMTVANSGGFRRRGQMLIANGLIFCFLLIPFALSGSFWVSTALCFLLGFSQNFFFASTNTVLQGNAPAQLRGRVVSIYAFIMMGFMPLGSTLLGVAGEHFGVALTVGLGGAASLVFMFATIARVRELRTLE